MSLKHGLLGLLNYSDMTGYELGKTFNDSLSFFWQAQSSQIYRELNKMEAVGLLISHIEIQTDKPNKRIYSITENGKTELQNWLNSEIPDELMPTRSDVLMRLFFSSTKSTEENIEMLKTIITSQQRDVAQLKDVSNTIDDYKTMGHSDKDALYWDLTAEFGRAYSKMCIAWAESCITRLEELK